MHLGRRKLRLAAVAVVAAVAMVAAACSSSSSSSGTNAGHGAVSLDSGLQGLNPGTGAPKSGGTLNMLGQGDVDYMDYNVSYYTIGAMAQRLWVRGLYAYPAIPGKTTTVAPDLATAAPAITNGGKTFSVTIRTGADWNTSPPRQVTAADAVRGLQRACNPVQPFGGLPDFESLIVGYTAFCTGFAKLGASASASAMKKYINTHQISGVTASGQTITYNLVHPASYFSDMLQLDPFSPAPAESLNYVPASAASAQHLMADGPYQVQTYVPARTIDFVRNPAWNASTDPIRKAYVDKVHVSETGNEATILSVMKTNTAAGGIGFDAFPPVDAMPALIQQMLSGQTKDLNLGSSFSTNPYLVFNEISQNNGGALGKVAVRQALSYGTNRAHLIQDCGGPKICAPLTHVLPDGINGAQDVPKGYNPYPYNPSKAKSMLAANGASGMTLKLLYRPSSSIASKMVQTLQSDWGQIGVKVKLVGVPDADFYTKYLFGPTSTTKSGVFDVALPGWGPDWYGDAATSFFKPLFYGPPSYPPVGGSNYGYYNNPTVNSLITQAGETGSPSAAAKLWAQADQDVMKDAVFFPITDPLVKMYHSSFVHNVVYIPGFEGQDPTNVWLSTPG